MPVLILSLILKRKFSYLIEKPEDPTKLFVFWRFFTKLLLLIPGTKAEDKKHCTKMVPRDFRKKINENMHF